MSEENKRADHDGAYRQLFEQKLMVQQLIEVFVGAEVAAMLDFSGMEQVPAAHRSETLLRRENDVLWKIPTVDGESLYVVLMLEFQSSPDPLMALRMMTYTALYFERTAKNHKWSELRGLPPVLPIVLYNGSDDWDAKRNVRELILLDEDSPLAQYQPKMEYCLIDVGDYPQERLREGEDLVSTLFLLEQAKRPHQVHKILEVLIKQTLGDELDGIRKGFLAWVARVLYTRMDITLEREQLDSLTEVKDMLAENLDKWIEETKAEGHAIGLEEGRAKGLEEGRVKGLEQGLEQGLAFALTLQMREKFGESEERDRRIATLSKDLLLKGLTAITRQATEDEFWAEVTPE